MSSHKGDANKEIFKDRKVKQDYQATQNKALESEEQAKEKAAEYKEKEYKRGAKKDD